MDEKILELDAPARLIQDDVPHFSATDQHSEGLETRVITSHSEPLLPPHDNNHRNRTPEVYAPAEHDHSNATHDEFFQLGLAGPSAAASIANLTYESSGANTQDDGRLPDTPLQETQQYDATGSIKKGKEPVRRSSDTTAGHRAKPNVTFDLKHHQSESSEDEVVWKGRMKRKRAAAPVRISNAVAQPLIRQSIHQPSYNGPYQQLPMDTYHPHGPFYGYYPQRPPFELQYASVNPPFFPSAYWTAYHAVQPNGPLYPTQPQLLASPSRPRQIEAPAENFGQEHNSHMNRIKTKLFRVAKVRHPKVRTLKRIKQRGRDVSKIVEPEAPNREYTDPRQESTRPEPTTQHASPSEQLAQIRHSYSDPFRTSLKEDDLLPAQPSVTRNWQEPRRLDAQTIYQLGTEVATSTPAFATWRRAGSASSLPTQKAGLRALPRLRIPGTSESGTEDPSVRREPLKASATICSPQAESALNGVEYRVERDTDAHAVSEGLVIPVAVQCSHATLHSRFSTLLHSNWPERSAPNDDGSMFVKRARQAKRMKKRDGSHSIELSCDNGPSSNAQQSEYRLQWL
jgi:hypothetical protein